jgi:4'-phosphopantetheinyl transferase
MNRPDSLWRGGSDCPDLASDDVHVWRVDLELPEDQLRAFAGSLSTEERQRAMNFLFAPARARFIAAHAALRSILSRYVGLEPTRLGFVSNTLGKPSLDGPSGGEYLRFSLAHSGPLALCAVASRREVGVDLEHLRDDLPCDTIAEQFFSASEVAALRGLPEDRRIEAFFCCWTRKEAYVKARGRGFSLELDTFEVSLNPEEAEARLNVPGEPEETLRWSIRPLSPGPGYIGALAVEGRRFDLQTWHWRPDQAGAMTTGISAMEATRTWSEL